MAKRLRKSAVRAAKSKIKLWADVKFYLSTHVLQIKSHPRLLSVSVLVARFPFCLKNLKIILCESAEIFR